MTIALMITLGLTVLVGMTLGMLGSGGGVLLLPLLVYVSGIEPREAVGLTLSVVLVVSAMGALLHWRHGHLHGRAVKFMSAPGLAGTAIGSQLTHLIPGGVLMLLFGVIMLAVGASMYIRRDKPACGEGCRVKRCMSIGFGVGILTGLLGVGGGFIIVPSLVLLAGVPIKPAVGASLAIISINAAAGLAIHSMHIDIDWALAGWLMLAAVGGLVIGELIGDRIGARSLQGIFAAMLIVIAVTLIILNVPAV